MNDGFIPFKGLGWAVAGLLALTAVMSGSSGSQWDALRLRTDRTAKNELQRPSLLKKLLGSGGTTTTGTTTGTSTGTTTGTSTGTTTGTTGTTTGTMTAAGYPELSMIPSNFDITTEFVNAAIPPSNAPDTVGAFRFICGPGQVLADDPIMYPGQPGASHLHQFYGNTAANAYSTYSSLRTTGQSTCMSPLNRSAYWMPALLDGKGNVVRPDYVQVYYKRFPKGSPECTMAAKACIPLPNGLRFIFGRDMTNLTASATGNFHWICQTTQGGYPPNGSGPNNNGLGYPDMQKALAVCGPGLMVAAQIDAPNCWDGVNLDSPNHRSHVSYMVRTATGTVCPSTHPYLIPGFIIGARWSIMQGDDTTKWALSSDAMAPNMPPGWTFHADWFGAWDNTVLAMWNDNCIDKLLSCAGGNLGNGKMMKMYSGFSWTANPRLVPIPG